MHSVPIHLRLLILYVWTMACYHRSIKVILTVMYEYLKSFKRLQTIFGGVLNRTKGLIKFPRPYLVNGSLIRLVSLSIRIRYEKMEKRKIRLLFEDSKFLS